MKRIEAGYTLVELMVSIVIISVLSLGAFELFTSLLHSAIVEQRQAVEREFAKVTRADIGRPPLVSIGQGTSRVDIMPEGL